MSLSDGTNIIRDGLTFYYDMSNTRKSWLGEPTTNLVLSPKSITTGYAAASGVVRLDNQILNFDNTLTAGSVSNTGWIAYTSASTVNGNKYTASWYVKAGTTTSCSFNWGGAHQGNRTDFTFNLLTGQVSNLSQAEGEIYDVSNFKNGWWRVSYSSTLSSGNAFYPQLNNGSGTMYVGGLQIEQKPYATRLVIGTRTNTQSLFDLTNNNTITVNSLTYNSNNTFSFNGTSNYITLSNQSIPIYNSSYTLEAWIKRETLNANHGIIGDLQFDYQAFYVNTSNKLVSFHRRNDTASNSITSISSITTDWTHVAVVFDITAGKRLYVNGVLDTTNSNTTEFGLNPLTLANRGPKYIGRSDASFFGSSTRYFNGEIGIFKGYTKALTAQEILNNFNATRRRYL